MKVCIKVELQKSNVRNVYVHTNDYEQADHNYLYTPKNIVWFISCTVVLTKCF